MKLVILLSHNDEATLNAIIPIALTAAYANDELTLCALGNGSLVFLNEHADQLRFKDMDLRELIGQGANFKICMCLESTQCTQTKADFIPGIEITDLLTIVQIIRDADHVLTF